MLGIVCHREKRKIGSILNSEKKIMEELFKSSVI